MSTADEYNRKEFEAGRLTWQHITRAFQMTQAALGIDVDGRAGPATRAALVPAPAAPRPPVDRLKVAGERALARALGQWKLDIRDWKRTAKGVESEADRVIIDDYIRRGLGWTWQAPYAGDGAFEWCGAFAAWCWYMDLLPELRRDYLPSCYRLFAWSQGLTASGEKPKAPIERPTFLALDENSTAADVLGFAGTGPRAGDLLIVGDGKPEYGEHITVVEKFDAAGERFYTVEGNGGGTFPDGTRGQGVVRAIRPLGRASVRYIARRLYRPTLAHLMAVGA